MRKALSTRRDELQAHAEDLDEVALTKLDDLSMQTGQTDVHKRRRRTVTSPNSKLPLSTWQIQQYYPGAPSF